MMRDVHGVEAPAIASPLREPPAVEPEVPRQVIRARVKLLFIAANSRDDPQLALGEELRAIAQALRESRFRDSFDIVSELAVRQKDLQRALLQHRPDIVHFACHGSRHAELVLLRDDGTPGPVTIEALTSYFRILRDNVALVVLNACFSRAQAAAVERTVGMAIGMHQRIADDAAIRFSEAFYQGLGYGCSVRQAFELGVTAIATVRSAGDGAPALFARAGIDPSAICLVGASPPRARRRWPVWLLPIAAALSLVAWRWLPGGSRGAGRGADRSAGTMPSDAAVAAAPAPPPPTPAPPTGMVRFAGARIRPGVFDPSQRPPACAALEANEDCMLRPAQGASREVTLEDFDLDRYEVTNRDFAAWLDGRRDAWRRNAIDPAVLETRAEPSVFLVRTGTRCGLDVVDGRVRPVADRANQPASCMTWLAARDYCLAHRDRKRLPLDAEWELAAKGSEGRAFPWGSAPPQPDRVAFRRGNSSTEYPVDVGTSAQDVSPQGIYDLGGNVAEWVDEPSASDAIRPIRGGSWNSRDLCHLLSSGCKHIKAESFARDVGLRCARTAVMGNGSSQR
jgi:formylglycine-generating enzyme required for sulfatase activity